jgi:hypothetical protein
MTGDASFNEVFFTNVRVPRENIVNDRGRGWEIATSLLRVERSMLGRSNQTETFLAGCVDVLGEAGLLGDPIYRERLTRRDRSFLEGFAAWQAGNPVVADSIYQKLVADYPEDVEGWYRLGEVQFHYNPVRGRSADTARVAFQRALELDPNLEALRFHLMEMALSDRRFDAFDSLASTVDMTGEAALRRTAPRVIATRNQGDIDRLITELRGAADGTVFAVAAATAQYLRDFDNAERVAALLTDTSRMWVSQGVGHLFIAELNTWLGSIAGVHSTV